MSLRKLASLTLMIGLVALAALAGCAADDVQEAHVPPNIGTDPATGGFDPATGTTSVAGVVTVVAPPAVPTPTPTPVVPQTFTTQLGVVLQLTCPPANVVTCDPAVFACQQDAKNYLNAVNAANPGNLNCHGLDGNNDGDPCEALRVVCP